MRIVELGQIKEMLGHLDVLPTIEQGFVSYSEGKAIVPSPGELVFEDPPGDVHLKYGYLEDDDYYIVKISSGFYENPQLNLPPNDGMMLLFDRRTGKPLSILLDEGWLTDLRTAAAGAIAAKHLAPNDVRRIGILGTGTQARMQLLHLRGIAKCREVLVWGRSKDKLASYREEVEAAGFSVGTTLDAREVASTCDLIVTATNSSSPLLWADQIQEGTHITAVGADSPHKQELDPAILAKADLVVADSVSQCVEFGEIAHALRKQVLRREETTELGRIISGKAPGRASNGQITVSDLTGVAVQDLQIAKAVYEGL